MGYTIHIHVSRVTRVQWRRQDLLTGLVEPAARPKVVYTVSQKNCANLFFAPCLSNMNRFQ